MSEAEQPKKIEVDEKFMSDLLGRVKEMEKKLGLDKPKPTKEEVLRSRKRS